MVQYKHIKRGIYRKSYNPMRVVMIWECSVINKIKKEVKH